MNKKKIFLLTFILIFTLLSVSSYGGDDAKAVREIPSGFIHLPKGGGNWDNGLHYVSWESQISFLDDDENCIYQTGFDNSDFIVKYENEYYVSEEKILELIDIVNSLSLKTGDDLSPIQNTNTISASYPSYNDIPANVWYVQDIAYVTANGIMYGVDNNKFEPESSVTRGMIVTMLYRIDGQSDINAKYTFTDVQSDAYYTDAISWANANGIVYGYSDTEFAPDDSITREQMAAILWRYAQYKGMDVSENANITDYTDADKVTGYAVPAMQWACGNGIISGINGALVPQGNATRAQAAAILHRFCSMMP